jgi:hypothetical protein
MQNYLAPVRTFVAVAAILAILLSACSGAASSPGSSAGPSTPPTASPSVAVGPLVSLETQGGHCLEGACGGTVVIDTDGRVHSAAPENKELGTLSDVLLQALTTEIEQADFAAITSRPFTDTCPIAFDGLELIYTFTTPSGVEKIDSCQVIVDPAHPLFAATDAAFASVQPR